MESTLYSYGLQEGMRVEHGLLGKGTVVGKSITHDIIVQVHFDNYQGNSQWMLDATLKVIKE